MINPHCIWYGGQRGSWSQTIVEWLVNGFAHHTSVDSVPHNEGAIMVAKADSLIFDLEKMNCFLFELSRLTWAVAIIVSNEEGRFPTDRIRSELPRVRIWLQSRSPGQFAHRYIPWGWTAAAPRYAQVRRLDWSFMGQVTHERRRQCVEAFEPLLDRGFLVKTQGFSQGLPRELYHETLAVTRMVPCPSGPITVDSFRVCEALQMGAIPMLDTTSPRGEDRAYWSQAFDQCPLPMIDDWSTAPAVMDDWLVGWEHRQHIVLEWWSWQKAVWTKTAHLHMRELHGSV